MFNDPNIGTRRSSPQATAKRLCERAVLAVLHSIQCFNERPVTSKEDPASLEPFLES